MTTSSRASPVSEVLTEQGRLNTFRGWPHSAAVEPASLAKSGFFYLGQADRVRCAFCGGTLKNWQHGDDPWQEHQSHFPHCQFVQGKDVGNVPISSNSGSTSQMEVCRLNPHHPEYQTMDSRRASFKGWPQNIAQQPEDLADAGFFYVGQGDHARCFCCGGALRNWEPNDRPWEEHARWFPRCPYLLQQKGRGFIMEMQQRRGTLGRAHVTSSPASSPCRRGTSSSPSRRGLASNDRLAEVMQSDTVKDALAMGFTQDQVTKALQKILKSSGGRKPELARLISVIVGDDNHRIQRGAGEGVLVMAPEQSGSATSLSGDDRTLCKICLDRQVEVTFLPCGHLVSCAECSKHIKQCPVCRMMVKASIRTYLS